MIEAYCWEALPGKSAGKSRNVLVLEGSVGEALEEYGDTKYKDVF